MPNPLYNEKMIADFERVCLSWEYSHETAHVENTSGGTVMLRGLPYPVKAGSAAGKVEVMTAAEVTALPSAIAGFLVTNRTEEIADGSESMAEYAYLARGEAVVLRDAFPAEDLAGDAYAAADFETALAGMNPPVVVADMTGALKSTPYKFTG